MRPKTRVLAAVGAGLIPSGTGAARQGGPAPTASYYAVRPDDPKAVYVTRERFGAAGDGVADDAAALQRAIDAVQETTGEGVVFLPEGRYRLSTTLHVWPGIRIIGYGGRRPVFVLGDRTPGYQDPEKPRYMVFFAGRRPSHGSPPPDANPGTFYSALSNVDLEIGAGNPGAVGVRARYAQHCFTSHVEFRIGSGLAGVHEGGNVAEDVTLIRPHFRNVPTAIEIEAGRPDDLFVKDARLENVGGPAVIVSLEDSPRTQVNMENVACRNVATFALFRESGRRLAAPGGTYVVKTLSHGLHYADLGAPGETKTVFDASPLVGLHPNATQPTRPTPT